METKALLKEIDAVSQTLRDKVIIDPKDELLNNVYPLLRLIVMQKQAIETDVIERLQLCEDATAEMIQGSDDRIHERLASRIQATIELGMDVCKWVVAHATKEMPPNPELVMIINAYRDSAGVLMQMVDDVLVVDIEDDDENDEEEDDARNDRGDDDGRDGRRDGDGGDSRAKAAQKASAQKE